MSVKNKLNCKNYYQRKKQKVMDNLLQEYETLMEMASDIVIKLQRTTLKV